MGKKTKTASRKTVVPPKKVSTRKANPKGWNSIIPWMIIVITITGICMSPMLRNGFTNWDDEFYILRNALLPGPDWSGIFSQPVVSNYHPVTILSFAINYAISGVEPWSYHLLNWLLHLVNTGLVFLFIYRLTDRRIAVAFITALAFGIHPLHVESVAWASERKDVLYTLFFLLSLLQYLKFLRLGKSSNFWFCFLFFVLSLLSKPAAIVLPIVLFLLDYWYKKPLNKKAIMEKVPFFLVAILFTIITLRLQSVTAMTTLDVYPIWVRLFFACYVIMIYFIRFFIPYPLSAFHPFPPPDDLGWAVYISPLFVLVLLFVAWRFRKNKFVVFGFLFFLVNLLLVLQIISIGFTIVSERYTYIPYIGLAFVFGIIVEKYLVAKNNLARGAAIVVFAIFGFLSYQHAKVWKDSNSLWTDVIRHYPNTSLARAERAQFNYNKAIMNPTDSSSFIQVIEDCTVAIHNNADSLRPDEKRGGSNLYYMRGISFNSIRQYEKAFHDFNICLLINPNNNEALYHRGTLLVNYYKKYNEALEDFNKAIQIRPEGKYYMNRSICYYKLGDSEHARNDAKIALEKGIQVPANYRQALGI